MIAYQQNLGGIIALLPNGKVEFLHSKARRHLEDIKSGILPFEDANIDQYIITDPLVDLRSFHLSAPLIAFIEITNLCNLKCKHCYAFSGLKRENEIDKGIIFKLLDDLDELGVLQVFLTGGEVFAHPDAVEIINYSMQKSFSTQIFTNGLLITEKKLAQLEPGVSFFISFDTADPERTIRGKMNFPKLKEKFEWMKVYGHSFRTAISVHRNNIEDAEEIFEWCVENNYPRPQWLETHPIGRALLHPEILLQAEDVDRVFKIYKRCMDRYGKEESKMTEVTDPAGEPSNSFFSIDTIKFCQRLEHATGYEKCGRSVAYITSAGDVFPCSNCMSNNMFRAGNLRNTSFKDIWEHGFDAIRNIGFKDYKVCDTCPVHQQKIWCQFKCPPLAKNVSKDPLGCGATEYLQLFMIHSNRYWEERRKNNIKLVLNA